jgi:hypothetical protein
MSVTLTGFLLAKLRRFQYGFLAQMRMLLQQVMQSRLTHTLAMTQIKRQISVLLRQLLKANSVLLLRHQKTTLMATSTT